MRTVLLEPVLMERGPPCLLGEGAAELLLMTSLQRRGKQAERTWQRQRVSDLVGEVSAPSLSSVAAALPGLGMEEMGLRSPEALGGAEL